MRKWAALALAGCFWAGTGAADEALDAWRAAYPAKLDALQTVREKAEFRMEMAIGGMKSVQVMESEFLFRRPDALVAKGPFAELYVLGTNATTYQKMMQNEYRRETADEGLAAYLEDFRGEMLMLQADKKLLLQADADGREEILDELLGELEAQRFLDLGAGVGSTVIPLADRWPERHFTGVENAPLTWLTGKIHGQSKRA